MEIENEKDLLLLVLERLNSSQIQYMVTGSMASSFWGLPRSTHDIDIVILLGAEEAAKISQIFQDDFYLSKEAIEGAIKKEKGFNLIHTKTGLKVDFWPVKSRTFHQEAFKRRVKTKLFGVEAFLASAENTIISKLLWYKESESERQLQDIKGILATQGGEIDRDYIDKWVSELGLKKIWQRL